MEKSFAEWLREQMDARELSQADMVRLSRDAISNAQISRILSGQRKPGEDTLNGIARAFGLSPVQVYRAAGLLPPDKSIDALTEEGIEILHELEPSEKEDAIRYLRLRRQVQEERGKYNARKRKERPAGA